VLTGGQSRRLGRDKATLALGGTTLAERTARLVASVVSIAVEVGPGVSGLAAVSEAPAGSGPLGAIAAGYAWLTAAGLAPRAPCLVVACDLPHLTRSVLETLATWPTETSVLPQIAGQDQPLCARWSWTDLAAAAARFDAGERSLRSLPERASATRLDDEVWGEAVGAFADLDTPDDLRRLGLRGRLGPG
jgi:molybdenum cofactor guanylyltransferase